MPQLVEQLRERHSSQPTILEVPNLCFQLFDLAPKRDVLELEMPQLNSVRRSCFRSRRQPDGAVMLRIRSAASLRCRKTSSETGDGFVVTFFAGCWRPLVSVRVSTWEMRPTSSPFGTHGPTVLWSRRLLSRSADRIYPGCAHELD